MEALKYALWNTLPARRRIKQCSHRKGLRNYLFLQRPELKLRLSRDCEGVLL